MRVAAITMTIASLVVAVAPRAEAVPQIEIPLHLATITPGGTMSLQSSGWAGKAGTCSNKVKFKIKDSNGTSFTIGNFSARFSLFEDAGPYWVYRRSVDVPSGIAPGRATLVGYQSWEVGFAGLGCVRLFEHDAKRPITIAGAVGNDPPVIEDLSVPEVPQGVGTPITWTASEPCSMEIALFAEVRRGELAEIGSIASDIAGVAGPNQYLWDGSIDGSYLPPGTHRLRARCTDASGGGSAPRFTDVTVRYP